MTGLVSYLAHRSRRGSPVDREFFARAAGRSIEALAEEEPWLTREVLPLA